MENPIDESAFTRFYNFLVEIQDPRTSGMLLMGSPIPLICILTAYLLFCNYLGPYIMRDRKPFELKKTLIVYNFVQVLCSAYMVYEASQCGWGPKNTYNLLCQPVSYDRSPRSMRVSVVCVTSFYTKYLTNF